MRRATRLAVESIEDEPWEKWWYLAGNCGGAKAPTERVGLRPFPTAMLTRRLGRLDHARIGLICRVAAATLAC